MIACLTCLNLTKITPVRETLLNSKTASLFLVENGFGKSAVDTEHLD